jgi:predicted PurR-regulated permease PerM
MKEITEEVKKKFDINRLNEILRLGSKILKIIYAFIIILVIYALTLVLKEWGILKFILTLLKILSPFFIGLVVAWLLEPVVRYLHEKKMNRILGTLLVYVVLMFVLYLVFNTMIPLFYEQIKEFTKVLPGILEDVIDWFNNLFDGFKSNDLVNFDNIKAETIDSLQKTVVNLANDLPTTFVNIFKGTLSAFGTFALGLIIGFYLLFDFDNAGNVLFNIIPKKYRNEVKSLFIEVNSSLFGFVKGTLLTSLLVFVLSAIAFSIVGLQAPLLFALICAITNIIPFIGPYLGAVPAAIVGFSQGPGVGIVVCIVLLVIQTIEGNFIHPLVMSKTMKLHPVTILISLLIFEHFFGILGMIIATPVVAAVKLLIIFLEKKYKAHKEKKLELEAE